MGPGLMETGEEGGKEDVRVCFVCFFVFLLFE